jgi:hypothetical protein
MNMWVYVGNSEKSWISVGRQNGPKMHIVTKYWLVMIRNQIKTTNKVFTIFIWKNIWKNSSKYHDLCCADFFSPFSLLSPIFLWVFDLLPKQKYFWKARTWGYPKKISPIFYQHISSVQNGCEQVSFFSVTSFSSLFYVFFFRTNSQFSSDSFAFISNWALLGFWSIPSPKRHQLISFIIKVISVQPA